MDFSWDDHPDGMACWDDVKCDEKFHEYFISL